MCGVFVSSLFCMVERVVLGRDLGFVVLLDVVSVVKVLCVFVVLLCGFDVGDGCWCGA